MPTILKNTDDYKQDITRLEFTHLVVIYMLSNKNFDKNISTAKYTDINDNYVNMATSLNIINGYTDGTFKPYSFINRAEASVMIYNAEKKVGYLSKGSINKFKDYKFIPNWAVESVGAVTNAKIINGYPNKTFAPSKNITRQEALVMVSNLVNSKSYMLDAFDIAKNDQYMSKKQYDFVLNNIPISKYKIDVVKEKIFQTSSTKRKEIYTAFTKLNQNTSNEIISSPNIIFEDNNNSYIMGIEKRKILTKVEQRVFMMNVKLENSKIESTYSKEYSSWYTVQ